MTAEEMETPGDYWAGRAYRRPSQPDLLAHPLAGSIIYVGTRPGARTQVFADRSVACLWLRQGDDRRLFRIHTSPRHGGVSGMAAWHELRYVLPGDGHLEDML